MISPELLQEIKKDEGFRLWPYEDSVGKKTVWYGHNLVAAPLCPKATYLIKQAAEEQLLFDLQEAVTGARTFPWFHKLSQTRQDVVINMIFNMGLNSFKEFKQTIRYMKEGKHEQASKEMLDSKWARQVGPRAIELSELYKRGFYV